VQAFRVRAGDDASCLNLYQPRKPLLFGTPPALVERGGFQFASSLATTAEEKANPWRLLDGATADGVVPVIGEANTVAWMLKSGLIWRGKFVVIVLPGLYLSDAV
jgi:hypothetical protein